MPVLVKVVKNDSFIDPMTGGSGNLVFLITPASSSSQAGSLVTPIMFPGVTVGPQSLSNFNMHFKFHLIIQYQQ